MNKEEYYIPNLEDLYIGYQYEEYIAGSGNEYRKVKTDMDHLCFVCNCYDKGFEQGWIRTKYLDKEDIESLGWKDDGYGADGDMKFYIFDNSVSYYLHHDHSQGILITKYENGKSKGQLFLGECKSINELKTIMKLINI